MKTILLTLCTLASFAFADADQVKLSNGKTALSAAAIWQVFNVNPLSVESAIGKCKYVFGNVEKIARDIGGKPYLLLMVRGEIGSVKCMFGDADVAALRAINIGQRVFVEGTLQGMTLSIVTFTECQFTK